MTCTNLTIESVLKLYFGALPSAQERALKVFHAALIGRDLWSNPAQPEPRLSLKAISRLLGKHPTQLWRLGVVDHCGESFGGGRKVYRVEDVLAYLRSPGCAQRREEIRAKRRAKESTETLSEL
jgi:hypothetical protein